MKRILKGGCLGVLTLVLTYALLSAMRVGNSEPQRVVSSTAGEAKTEQVARIGETVQRGGWEVTLLAAGPYERFDARPPAAKPQGVLVVAELKVRNLSRSTSNFTTNDFLIRVDDGREFKAAGQTATIERGFLISQTVQPGLTTENRVVFDLDPAATGRQLVALGIVFDVMP